MSKTYQMNMGGKRVDAAGQETFDELNPYSGEVFARVPGGKRETSMVQINDQTVNYEPQVPVGGMQGSGQLGSQAAPDEFTELRWMSMQRTGWTFP